MCHPGQRSKSVLPTCAGTPSQKSNRVPAESGAEHLASHIHKHTMAHIHDLNHIGLWGQKANLI